MSKGHGVFGTIVMKNGIFVPKYFLLLKKCRTFEFINDMFMRS